MTKLNHSKLSGLLALMLIALISTLSTVQAATTYYNVGHGGTSFNSKSLNSGLSGGGWSSLSGTFDIYSDALDGYTGNAYVDYTDLIYTYNLGYISTKKDLTVTAFYSSYVQWHSTFDYDLNDDFLGVQMDVRLYKGSALQNWMSSEWSPGIDASDGDYINEYDYLLSLSKSSGTWTMKVGYTYYLKVTITYWSWADSVSGVLFAYGSINDNYHAGHVTLSGSIKDTPTGGCFYWNGNIYC